MRSIVEAADVILVRLKARPKSRFPAAHWLLTVLKLHLLKFFSVLLINFLFFLANYRLGNHLLDLGLVYKFAVFVHKFPLPLSLVEFSLKLHYLRSE